VIFNQVPHLEVALQGLSFIEAVVIPRLASLLVSHGLQSLFNISLAHRHFALNSQEEQLVRLKSERCGLPVAHVFRKGSPDPVIMHKYDLRMPEDANIVPDTFMICDNELLPYEFSCVESGEARRNLQAIQAMRSQKEFLEGWSRVLLEHEIEGRIGVALREEEEVMDKDSSRVPGVMVFDVEDRVDILYMPTKQFQMSVSPDAPPAEWEVGRRTQDGVYECPRTRFCRDWMCSCGTVNSGPYCTTCGAPRRVSEN